MKIHKPITAAIALLLATSQVFSQTTNENHTITPPSTSDWDIPSTAQEGDNVNIKYTGDKYVKSVKVVPLPTSVTIKTTDCLTMIVGETLSLQAEIYPDISGVDKNVTWSVSSGNAVTVDANGKVTAVQEGDATVTVTTNTNNKTDNLTISVKKIPSKCIPGVFSVGECKRVCFSKGNLQYNVNDETWRFAANQWDYVGGNETNAGTISGSTNVNASGPWIDLFGWGMWLDEITDKAKITNTSINDSEYAPALNGDNEFSNNKRAVEGEEWMTLSYSEWDYLIKTRTNASNLYGVAKVNGVKGLILLPDEWIDPKPDDKEFNSGLANSTVNEYTAAQWSVMEASGTVFLPAAGCCDRASHSAIGFGGGNSWGDYWTSTAMDKNNARYLTFTLGQVVWNDFKQNRNIRRSARLVRPL